MTNKFLLVQERGFIPSQTQDGINQNPKSKILKPSNLSRASQSKIQNPKSKIE